MHAARQDDGLFREAWLSGKAHPLSTASPAEPLEILELDVPPGTIVSCLSHCPHAVSPKAAGRGTRLCTLFCYAQPDLEQQYPRSSERCTWSLPKEFEQRAIAGEIAVEGGSANFLLCTEDMHAQAHSRAHTIIAPPPHAGGCALLINPRVARIETPIASRRWWSPPRPSWRRASRSYSACALGSSA